MGPSLTVALITGFVLLAVGLLAWSYLAEKRRTEKMTLAAADLGLAFHPTGAPALIDELASFHLFSQGRSKKIKNMLHGETGAVDVALFDYQYTTGGGKNSHTSHQTVAYFRSPNLDLPQFVLRPENVFHKIGGVLGYQDIDFDSHPRFSAHYLLRGASEPQIRRLFTDDVLTFFESQTGLSAEGSHDRLIFYRAGKRVDPDRVRPFFEEGFNVYALFARPPQT